MWLMDLRIPSMSEALQAEVLLPSRVNMGASSHNSASDVVMDPTPCRRICLPTCVFVRTLLSSVDAGEYCAEAA